METLDGYLAKLASEAPAPGGGSAAMVVGAAGCALVAMVARICLAAAKYESVHSLAARLSASADELRGLMLELRVRDEAAFDAVVAARGDKEAMQRALAAAAAAPLAGARAALDALRLANESLALGNGNLISDVGCAAEFAHAALLACAYNVRINHKFMKDAQTVETQSAQLASIEGEGLSVLQSVRDAVRDALS